MALARAEIPFIVQTQSGAVVQGASIQVNNRVGGGAATVYAAETGTGTLPNPITTGLSGRVDGWLEEGQYALAVSGPGITTYSQPWDVRSGGPTSRIGNATVGNVGPASQGAVGFGPDPSDVVLYRSAAGTARLNGALVVDGQTSIGQAQVVGTSVSLAIQDSTGAGLLKANFTTGFADSANIPRLEVGNNATNNDALLTGLAGVALRRVGVAAQGFVLGNTTGALLPIPTTNSLRVEYAGGRGTLNLTSTSAETGITIGGDVEIYRSAANVLKTPDTFDAIGFRQNGTALASTHLSDTANIAMVNQARTWTAIQTYTADQLTQGADIRVRQAGDTFDKIRLGWDGYVYFGTGAAAYDVTLRRSGVGALRSSGTLDAVTSITANIGGANQVALGVASAGLVLGSLGDTNAYRASADLLATDDAFRAAGIITASFGGNVVTIGAVGPSAEAAITLGDATIRRSASGMVTITNDLTVRNLTVTGTQTASNTTTSAGSLTAAVADSGQVRIGNVGGLATVYFGTAEDTELRRDSADKLRTPNALQVDGLITGLAGASISGAGVTVNRALGTNETLAVQTAGVSRLRILADGTLQWAGDTGVADAATQLVRSGVGVITASGIFNATSYRQGGTALASTHLSDSAALARLASPIFTGTVTIPVLAITTREEVSGGSAAAPTQTFVGDSDTGLYSPGADQIGISTAGISRLTIGAAGTVAIAGALTIGGVAPVLVTDTRLTDSRNPTGTAAGMLTGTYPAPDIAAGVILNSHIGAAAAIADTKLAQIATAGKVADTAIPATIARLVGPALTGVPTAPTAAADTSTTQLATTGFVLGQASTVAPLMDGLVAIGTSSRYARADHVHATDTSRAPLVSPPLTGVPTAPTALAGNNTTQLATTAFVTAALGGSGGATFSSLTLTSAGLSTLNLSSATLNNGITIGADTNLYRSAVDTLKTDDSLVISGALQHIGSTLGFYNTTPVVKQARPTTLNGLIAALVNLGLVS